ncbi:hypothetical protein [Hymenobacter ruricola]|uniref:Uncharacterized protein n=1 Tax=Hymenobacter ruricola TaxID=2791023 RepID=A0ABS0HZ61_9BACT|nr:hypothetical protein [Hymenobacter ruricola]MBF9219980.1 hypothetical protein [Hymenobacter ruricola]
MDKPIKIRKPGTGEYQDLTGSINVEMRAGLTENFKYLCQKLGIDTTKYTPVALDIYATEYSPSAPHLSIFAKEGNGNEVTEFKFDEFPLATLLSFMRGYHILVSPDYKKIDDYVVKESIEL